MRRIGHLHRSDVERLAARNIDLCIGRHIVDEKARFEPPFRLKKPLNGFSGSVGAFSYSESSLGAVRKIGRYCSIAHHVHFGGAEHQWRWAATSSFAYDAGYIWKPYLESSGQAYTPRAMQDNGERYRPIEIGNDVWIGVGAFIRLGVHIGDGAVIGAHASVIRNVEPYAIVAGNPARVIKKRFSDAVIEQLQSARWWDYKFPDFEGFPVEEPERFLQAINEGKSRGTLQPYNPALFTGADLGGLLRKRPQDWLLRLLGHTHR